ncbi:FAD-binding oxidoreductase [Alphaproteobacteria bacterium]|nr:FAD-binding oxidoreductase [Alphaproteobacteria bacterium]
MKNILIIGAGIVGICTSIELMKKGYSVTLMDPNEPGSQTSYGNAGVISDSSLMIINNPQLLKSLFQLIFKNQTSFRYSKSFIFSRFTWVLRFLMFSHKNHMKFAAKALRELQVLSLNTHKKLIKKTNSNNIISKPGWLKLFKTTESYKKYSLELKVLNKHKAKYTTLNTTQIEKQFPDLEVKFFKGILFKNSIRVKSPLKLSKKYFNYFIMSGGKFVQESCKDLQYIEDKWVIFSNKNRSYFDQVVVSTGPWSKNILSNLGYNIPLAWERGYHHHFSTKKKISINPAIYDVEGGFVYSSNGSDVRVTSGVELTFLDAVQNEIQINESIQKLRKIIPLNKKLIDKPWLGSRPTIIDSLPMIGKAPRHKNLWFNFGHNHIGLSTSAGSAIIISEMIQNKKTSINADPFSPKRFSL